MSAWAVTASSYFICQIHVAKVTFAFVVVLFAKPLMMSIVDDEVTKLAGGWQWRWRRLWCMLCSKSLHDRSIGSTLLHLAAMGREPTSSADANAEADCNCVRPFIVTGSVCCLLLFVWATAVGVPVLGLSPFSAGLALSQERCKPIDGHSKCHQMLCWLRFTLRTITITINASTA